MAVMPLVWDVNADADVLDIAALTPSDGDMLYWATGGTRYNTVPSTSYMRGLLNTASEAALKAAVNLEIGVDVQAYDADLTTWAGLTPSAYFQTLVDDADAATARATLGLSIGSQVQAYDADLSTWAGVTPGTGVATALAVAVGSAGAVVVNGGALGTPSSGTLTSATGLPISTGVSGLGTGIATALAVNVGSAGAPVINGGALGTPSSGTLTNATGLPVGGISGLGTGVATFLATPSSANLVAAMTDEAGSGALYFTGGALGTPSSATLTNATGLPVSGITASTSTALGVGSIELGHASDTTLSRVSAGVVAIEGVEVTTNTASQTLTNKTLSSPTLSGTVAGSPGWASAQTFPTLTKVGAGAAPSDFIINGLGSGTSGGARLTLQHGGTFYAAIGTRSSIYGGAFDNKFNVYATTDLELHSDTSVLTFNGTAIPTISSTDTLTNKTLSSPTLSGTVAGTPTWSNVQVFPAGSGIANVGTGLLFNNTANDYLHTIDKDNTGVIFSTNSASRAFRWSINGSNSMALSTAAVLSVGGVVVPTISSTDTLSNKTLSSPTVSGTIAGGATWTGTQALNGGITQTSTYPYITMIDTDSTSGSRSAVIQINADSWLLSKNGDGGAYVSDLLKINLTTTVANFIVAPTANGVAIPTISSTDTLSNKTLSSPTLSGTVAGTPAWSGRQDFGNEVTVTGLNNQYAFGVRNRSTSGFFYQGATNSATPDYIFSRNAGEAVLTLGQDLSTTVAGGLVVGAPTGGNKGTGTANFAADIYKNNSAFTNPDYVFEHFYRGEIVEFAANDGASEYAGLMPLDALREFTRENLHLPQVPKSGGVGIFERGDYLLRAIEENTLYILALHEQIENLNQRLKELEK